MNGRVRDFLDLVREAYEYEFCLGRVEAEEVG